MKLWKILGIVGGLYGLIGPWLIWAGAAGSHTGGPSWLILFAATWFTLKNIWVFFFNWSWGKILGTIPILISFIVQISIWFIIGSLLGLLAQKIRRR